MDSDSEKEYEYRSSIGLLGRHFHKMGRLHWQYSDSIAQEAGLEPMPSVVKTLFDTVHRVRRGTLMTYRKRRFRIVNAETYEEVM